MTRLEGIEARLEAALDLVPEDQDISEEQGDIRYLLERVRELESQLHETKIGLRFAQIYAENALEYATDQTMIAKYGATGRLESHD